MAVKITYFVHGTTTELGRKQSIKLKEQTRDRLRECNYGDLNGASSNIVEPMQEDEAITKPFPNGESYEDVKTRISDFIVFLMQNYDGIHVAIVAHRAPQLSLNVLLKNKTWEQAFAEDWRNTHSWHPGWDYTISI